MERRRRHPGAARGGSRGQQGAARAQGVRMRMLARVHRLVQVLDPLLDGGEVLGLGELDEVGRLAHRDLGDHLQGGVGGGEGDRGGGEGVLVGVGVGW